MLTAEEEVAPARRIEAGVHAAGGGCTTGRAAPCSRWPSRWG
nr:sigma-70 factor domain-containing protein [Streptomyces sp. NRRL S-1022]